MTKTFRFKLATVHEPIASEPNIQFQDISKSKTTWCELYT